MTPEELRELSYQVAQHEGLTVEAHPEHYWFRSTGGEALAEAVWPGCKGYSGPQFAEDWSAAGPLLEEYGLSLRPMGDLWIAPVSHRDASGGAGMGETPLIAICCAVLALPKEEKP